jgi:hypothetical protein
MWGCQLYPYESLLSNEMAAGKAPNILVLQGPGEYGKVIDHTVGPFPDFFGPVFHARKPRLGMRPGDEPENLWRRPWKRKYPINY